VHTLRDTHHTQNDIATSFWNKVSLLAKTGKIISIDKVKDEIYNKNDSLEDWCRSNLPDNFFKDSAEVMAEYGSVVAWAMSMNHHYLPNALNEFMDVDEADAFLIAYTLADSSNRKLVTQEVSAPQRKNKIKMPDCCDSLGVIHTSTIEMFRQLGETF